MQIRSVHSVTNNPKVEEENVVTYTVPAPSAQAVAIVAMLPRSEIRYEQGNLAEIRSKARAASVAASLPSEPVAVVEQVEAGGVPARLYQPAGGEREVLVWLHGGGWMLGDLDSCEAAACAIANRAGCAVLSADYRLAPEHRYPAAIDDCWAVTQWAAEKFDLVAVGGDSAGGNLAAAVALRARDQGISLALQLLVYPVLDYRPDCPFYDEFRRRYRGFAGIDEYGRDSQEGIRQIWEIYIPEPQRRIERDASPLRADSFSRLAPALVLTAEHDILRGEGEEYSRLLKAAGVPTEIINYTGQVHGFFHLVGTTQDAKDAVDRSAAVLRDAFALASS
jgi:acetyl esterase